MRDHTMPLYKQLSAAGVKAPTVTPSADITPTTFNFTGLEPFTGDMRNYVQAIIVRLTTVVDPDAGGSAVDFDKLYKGTSGFKLSTQLLGEPFTLAHTRGSVLGHIYQVLAGGYAYPQPARLQIPANTDTDVTIDLYYVLPFSFENFVKPHETAQWIGFFDQGELEHRLAASTVYDGDYAGAVIKATTTVRAWIEYYPSNDNAIGVPFQFREYLCPGSSTEFVLRGVGQSSGLRGVVPGCGIAALAWLTDATGIGLSGADGVDEINRIDIPWRNQVSIDILDPYFVSLRRMVGKRVGPIASSTSVQHDGSGWPYTQAATVNNSLAAATAMLLPIIMPGRDFETSKAQNVQGDLTINMGFGSTPTGQSRFVTLELLEYSLEQLVIMTRAMGLDPNRVRPGKKAARKNAPDPRKLRYTRTVLRGI